ncbi:MAG: DUF1648 domain-containing protein [Chloroflexi bacterium]|nr:DUF1648 domain-containing protein [Chloroflexota bacterium]
MDSPEITPYVVRPSGISARPSRSFARRLNDRALVMLFGFALVLNLTLAIFLFLRYDALPEAIPLHFDANGLPDRIEPKFIFAVQADENTGQNHLELRFGIFGLPVIAFIIWLLNALLALATRERAARILFAAGADVVALLMWFGAINIIGGSF